MDGGTLATLPDSRPQGYTIYGIAMESFLLIICAFLLGCLVAIPAGPVQIEVVKRSLNGHLAPSLMVVFGAFIVDIAYGLIALFGIAPAIAEERVMAAFWLAGGVILVVLGIVTLRHGAGKPDPDGRPGHLSRKRWALVGGVSLSVTNPVMILWWLTAARLFQDVGLIRELTPRVAVTFLTAGSLGLASYLSALSFFLFWAKKFIPSGKLRMINTAFGVFLLCIASYFIATSLYRLLLFK